MIRLHLIAEGQTEEKFARDLLAPHLGEYNVFLDARCVMTSRDGAYVYRGGLLDYGKAKRDIQDWIKQDNHSECRWTTMFDLYALPDDFPEHRTTQAETDPYKRVAGLENALATDITDNRLIPYIQLHEFEALIFSDPQKLDWEYLEHDRQIKDLIDLVAQTQDQNPELINNGIDTAPSKRILAHIPEYDKVTAGVSVASRIGLSTLRAKCRHFNEWLTKLENLDKTGAVP